MGGGGCFFLGGGGGRGVFWGKRGCGGGPGGGNPPLNARGGHVFGLVKILRKKRAGVFRFFCDLVK